MSITGSFKNKVISKSRLQDIFIISGTLVFSAALVLGLFPKTEIEGGIEQEYFFNLMHVIPISAAIYFIVISFSRKIYSKFSDFSSSIIFKMMGAFISVAVLPSLAIIIISNYIINETVSSVVTDETVYALQESINLSNDYIKNIYNDIDGELKIFEFSLKKGILNPGEEIDRTRIIEQCKFKNFDCIFYSVNNDKSEKILKIFGNEDENKNYAEITSFFQNVDFEYINRISNISIGSNSLLLGHIFYKRYIIAIIKEIPATIYKSMNVYKNSLRRYNQKEFLRPYFKTGTGILLLIIAIIIVIISISVSFFLSRNYARPILKLADAAVDVASGNFRISLKRDSSDEVGRLFQSFNTMVKQLDERKKLIFHMQRLEAWKEVARRLLHEIKNPLTPIKLSAERIQNRYIEGHADIRNIIMTGTDTIIEEVNVLNRILDEFSGFAKLPEIKPEYLDINSVIKSSVDLFSGHEGISFDLDLDDSLPRLFIDKILIRQVFTNIIQNSIDALEDKGHIYIKSRINEKTGAVSVSIKDDGPGIDEEDIDKIFDPAFTKKEKGTGLGLAIVEKIVLEHNAGIICHSGKGKGAEFVIEFPVLKQEEKIGKDIIS